MNYKNAFVCKKCPQSNNEQGCPMWWEFMAMDVASQKQELKKMCGYQALPVFLTEVISASNRPAAEIGMLRSEAERQKDEIVAGMGRVTQGIALLPNLMLQRIVNEPGVIEP